MITLLGALLGFFSSAFPDILRFFRDREDRAHEIAVLELQMKNQAQSQDSHLEEIRTTSALQEMQTLYQTYHTGVEWVDALNGTVRPVIAYAFFLLYAGMKLLVFDALNFDVPGGIPTGVMSAILWTEDDAAIFAGIIAFYFGQRAMMKLRK